MWSTVVTLTVLLFITLCGSVSYKDSALIRIQVNNKDDVEKIRSIKGLNLWNDVFVTNGSVTANVNAEDKVCAKESLKKANLIFEVLTEHLEELIDGERSEAAKTRTRSRGFSLETYHTLIVINRFMHSVARNNRKKAKIISIGRTYEKRKIKGIIIRGNQTRKPIVFFECGVHAREWISPATCLWIINELTSKQHPLLQKFEFHIFPVLNPDGYSYTWYGDRLWRKNRSPNYNSCVGTDLNRNFDFDFCRLGGSRNPCEEIYCGRNGFSELETQAIRTHVLRIKNSLKVYISLHSFSQLWMYPWSYTDMAPENDAQLRYLSEIGARALTQQYGTEYKVGNIATAISNSVSGSSLDWVYANTSCNLLFELELRDTGRYGFLLPANQIKPTASETWSGIQALLSNV